MEPQAEAILRSLLKEKDVKLDKKVNTFSTREEKLQQIMTMKKLMNTTNTTELRKTTYFSS